MVIIGFNDIELVNDFLEKGVYPKIHNSIFEVHKKIKVKNVLDLGCCTGLLAKRLSMVYDNVVGVEANKNYLCNSINSDNITYYHLKINNGNVFLFDDIIRKNNIQAVYARRVFPELYNTGGEKLLYSIANIFKKNNVKYIAIEGRIQNKKAVNPFKSLNNELQIFKEDYTFVHYANNVAVLKNNKYVK